MKIAELLTALGGGASGRMGIEGVHRSRSPFPRKPTSSASA